MRICIVSTGSELVRGKTIDTNSSWIASKLWEHGLEASRIFVVGDEPEEIEEVLRQAFDRFDLVIVGGGLGPTDDDITACAAAAANETNVARNEEAEAQVRAAFERLGRKMAEVNLKQADLPAGCEVLDNDCGTAPGFAMTTRRARAIFMPGVPHEMKRMFERHVAPALPSDSTTRECAVLRCFGMGESDIQAALKPVADAYPELRISFRVAFPEIEITAVSNSRERLHRFAGEAKAILGCVVFSEKAEDLPAAFGRALLDRGLCLATAESCTGGLIGHSITEVPGSSAYFRGGVVAYDNSVKVAILGVDQSLLDSFGAVSEEAAAAMARGVKTALGADVGIAVSGIAGPDGGTEDKPVGLVHIAVDHPFGIERRRRVFKGMERSRVKRAAAWTAMSIAFEAIRSGG